MPYYHVYINWEDEAGARWGEDIDFNIGQLNELVNIIKKEIPFLLKGIKIDPYDITKLEIWKTEERARGKPNTWDWIPIHGQNVTKDFIIALPTKPHPNEIKVGKIRSVSSDSAPSQNIFIVHGRDHNSIKELKEMLYDFGLNPIVLHEKASGGLTLA
jgi:hypothetical protein